VRKRSTWDPTLFEGTAYYYARYRPGYPPEFFKHVADRYALDGTRRLLDIGCGTGQLTIPLSFYFQEAVGLDPDPHMLVEAEAAARSTGRTNLRWLCLSSWDLPSRLGSFRLATLGASFHWMDREAVLKTVYDMLTTPGGLVVASEETHTPVPGHTDYRSIVQQLLRDYLGEHRRAGTGVYLHPDERHEQVIARSPFGPPEIWRHEYDRTWSIDEIVGYLYSTSYASKRLLGDQAAPFERELRHQLLRLEPSGAFPVQAVVTALLSFKPPASPPVPHSWRDDSPDLLTTC